MVDTTTLLASSSFFWYGIVPSFKKSSGSIFRAHRNNWKKKEIQKLFKKIDKI